MKYTLLELTQNVLSSMDSDEVNSINDTVESQQVAMVIRSAYFDIATRLNLTEQKSLFNLDSYTDNDHPILMQLPEDRSNIEWLKYNVETADDTQMQFTTLRYLTPEEFVNNMYMLNEDDDTVETFTLSGVPYLYKNNAGPKTFTTFDDFTVVFDSYDAEVDTNLQSSKTLAYGIKALPFTMSDTFVAPFDDSQFTLLLNEAKSLAWAELKQTQHVVASVNAKRGWTRIQRVKENAPPKAAIDSLPNYGRK